MDTFTPLFSFTCFYGILTFVVYTMTMVMIHRKPGSFGGSFFVLYKANFYINLVTFVNSFIPLRIPQNTCKNCTLAYLFEAHSETNYSSFPLGIFYCVMVTMAFIQYSMIFLVSLNRFTMFFYLHENDKRWKTVIPVVLLVIIIGPISQTYTIVTSKTYYNYLDSLGGYKTFTYANLALIVKSVLVYMIITTVASAILNIYSTIQIRKMNKNVKKNERTLLSMTLVSFSIQFIAFVDTMALQFFATTSVTYSVIQFFLPFVSDALTLSQPWILIAFSSLTRAELHRLLLGKLFKDVGVFTIRSDLQNSRGGATITL